MRFGVPRDLGDSFRKGRTILAIHGLKKGSKEVILTFEDGKLHFLHKQDCCENISLEDFNGDLGDLIGEKVVSFEVSSKYSKANTGDETWTFYSIRTTGGDLWMRWLGESNGYSATSVSVEWDISSEIDGEFSLYDMMDAIGIWVDKDMLISLEMSETRGRVFWHVNYNKGRTLYFVEPGEEIDATDFGVAGITKITNKADVIYHVIDYFTGPSYISPLTPGYFKKR